MQNFKKQIIGLESTVKKYKEFIVDYISNFFEHAAQVILDDVQIVNDWRHLLYLPEKYTEVTDLLKLSELGQQTMPEEYDETMQKIKDEILQMQDQDQGDQDDRDEDEQEEETDEACIYDQVYQTSEPIFSKYCIFLITIGAKLNRGNSATVIMMGREEAEQFLSSRLSQVNILKQPRGSVRYWSNVPEALKELKSLNQFKQKGRWELMPKDNNPESEGEEEEEYYEYDDYEEQLQNEEEQEEITESPRVTYNARESRNPNVKKSSRSPGRDSTPGSISIINHNRHYKK